MTFNVFIPWWLIYAALAVVWLFFSYAVLVVRSIDGSDQRERLIVSLLIAGCWPIASVINLIKALFRK